MSEQYQELTPLGANFDEDQKSMKSPDAEPKLSAEETRLARKFLKIFSAPDFNPYRRRPGVNDLGCAPYVAAVFEFMHALSHEQIGIPTAMDDPVKRFHQESLANATAIEARKFLCQLTRADRFVDGAFGTALVNGRVVAALNKILEA